MKSPLIALAYCFNLSRINRLPLDGDADLLEIVDLKLKGADNQEFKISDTLPSLTEESFEKMITDRQRLLEEQTPPIPRRLFNALMENASLYAKDLYAYMAYLIDSMEATPIIRAFDAYLPREHKILQADSIQEVRDIADDLHNDISKLKKGEQLVFKGGYGSSHSYLKQLVSNVLQQPNKEVDAIILEKSNSLVGRLSAMSQAQLGKLPEDLLEFSSIAFKHIHAGKVDGVIEDFSAMVKALAPGAMTTQGVDFLSEQFTAAFTEAENRAKKAEQEALENNLSPQPVDMKKVLEETFQTALRSVLYSLIEQGVEISEDALQSFLAGSMPEVQKAFRARGIDSREQPVWYTVSKKGAKYVIEVNALVNGQGVKQIYTTDKMTPQMVFQLLSFRKMPKLMDMSCTYDDIHNFLKSACMFRLSSTKDSITNEQGLLASIWGVTDKVEPMQKRVLLEMDKHADIQSIEKVLVRNRDDGDVQKLYKAAIDRAEKEMEQNPLLPTEAEKIIKRLIGELGIDDEWVAILRDCVDKALGSDALAAVDSLLTHVMPDGPVHFQGESRLLQVYFQHKADEAKSLIQSVAWRIAKSFAAPEHERSLFVHLTLKLSRLILPYVAKVLFVLFLDREAITEKLFDVQQMVTGKGRGDFRKTLKDFADSSSDKPIDFKVRGQRAYYDSEWFVSSDQSVDFAMPFVKYLVLENGNGAKRLLVRENLALCATMNLLRQQVGLDASLHAEKLLRNTVDEQLQKFMRTFNAEDNNPFLKEGLNTALQHSIGPEGKKDAVLMYDITDGKLQAQGLEEKAYLFFTHLTQGRGNLAAQAFEDLKRTAEKSEMSPYVAAVLMHAFSLAVLLPPHKSQLLHLQMALFFEEMNPAITDQIFDEAGLAALQVAMERYLLNKEHSVAQLEEDQENTLIKIIERRLKKLLDKHLELRSELIAQKGAEAALNAGKNKLNHEIDNKLFKFTGLDKLLGRLGSTSPIGKLATMTETSLDWIIQHGVNKAVNFDVILHLAMLPSVAERYKKSKDLSFFKRVVHNELQTPWLVSKAVKGVFAKMDTKAGYLPTEAAPKARKGKKLVPEFIKNYAISYGMDWGTELVSTTLKGYDPTLGAVAENLLRMGRFYYNYSSYFDQIDAASRFAERTKKLYLNGSQA